MRSAQRRSAILNLLVAISQDSESHMVINGDPQAQAVLQVLIMVLNLHWQASHFVTRHGFKPANEMRQRRGWQES